MFVVEWTFHCYFHYRLLAFEMLISVIPCQPHMLQAVLAFTSSHILVEILPEILHKSTIFFSRPTFFEFQMRATSLPFSVAVVLSILFRQYIICIHFEWKSFSFFVKFLSILKPDFPWFLFDSYTSLLRRPISNFQLKPNELE